MEHSAPLTGTASAANAVARVSYTHDAFIDLMIANPAISQGQIAQHFGYTQAWVSRVRNSDAFLARLAQRKADLVDPAILQSIDEKIRVMADKSLDRILEKLEVATSFDDAAKAFELSTKALGYGARAANVNVQQNFVVAMPAKAPDALSWAAKHAGGGLAAGVGSVNGTPVAENGIEDAKIVSEGG